MAHLGDGLRLVAEPGGGVGIWGQGLQDLDGARSFELDVVGAIDQAHGSLADEFLDLVLAQFGSGRD